MEIKTLRVGSLQTNCYLLKKDNKYLIIDPGDEADKIINYIHGDVKGILITHNHFDHVGALNQLKEYYHVPVYHYLNLKEGEIKISIFNFEVIYNPGHTKDSISFLFENDLFCGDFIFENSIGRTDAGGNNQDMKKSIMKIIKYSPSINIYPGHGNKTTLKNEIDTLLYFKDNYL
ncbi:MAG: MBL fold metallo-hydrolase [Bacilli bacterium]|nr:MBL fold metallo-hydrolase [Bacilli bacterium]MDD4407087.1 MBL fold metallo-hydrolase [Bacilli bacterium]